MKQKRTRKAKRDNRSGCLVLLVLVTIGGLMAASGRDNKGTAQSGALTGPTRDSGGATATITDTPTSSPTAFSTAGADVLLTPMWVSNNANARACSSTTCEIVETLPRGAAVLVRTYEYGETVNRSDVWYEVLMEGTPVYVHSSLLGLDAPATPKPTQPQQTSVQPQQSVPQQQQAQPVMRPRSCATAVAMGVGAAEIAQRWPGLDRDKDGVACYGD